MSVIPFSVRKAAFKDAMALLRETRCQANPCVKQFHKKALYNDEDFELEDSCLNGEKSEAGKDQSIDDTTLNSYVFQKRERCKNLRNLEAQWLQVAFVCKLPANATEEPEFVPQEEPQPKKSKTSKASPRDRSPLIEKDDSNGRTEDEKTQGRKRKSYVKDESGIFVKPNAKELKSRKIKKPVIKPVIPEPPVPEHLSGVRDVGIFASHKRALRKQKGKEPAAPSQISVFKSRYQNGDIAEGENFHQNHIPDWTHNLGRPSNYRAFMYTQKKFKSYEFSVMNTHILPKRSSDADVCRAKNAIFFKTGETSNLEVLALSGVEDFFDEDFGTQLANNCPKIKHFILSEEIAIFLDYLDQLDENVWGAESYVECLEVKLSYLNEDLVAEALRKLKVLTRLFIEGHTTVTILDAIAPIAPILKELSLTWVTFKEFEKLLQISKSFEQLKKLHIHTVHFKMNSDRIKKLHQHFPQLETVTLNIDRDDVGNLRLFDNLIEAFLYFEPAENEDYTERNAAQLFRCLKNQEEFTVQSEVVYEDIKQPTPPESDSSNPSSQVSKVPSASVSRKKPKKPRRTRKKWSRARVYNKKATVDNSYDGGFDEFLSSDEDGDKFLEDLLRDRNNRVVQRLTNFYAISRLRSLKMVFNECGHRQRYQSELITSGLDKCQELTKFEIATDAYQEVFMAPILQLANLQQLTFTMVAVDDEQFADLLDKCTKLSRISMMRCVDLTSKSINTSMLLAEEFPERELRLDINVDTTSDTLISRSVMKHKVKIEYSERQVFSVGKVNQIGGEAYVC